jgi:cytochrome b6-f complex iron-sulfur subunit
MSDLCRRTLLKGAVAGCGVGLLSACGGGTDTSAAPAQPPAPASAGAGSTPPAGGLRLSLTAVADIPVGGAVTASAPDGTKLLISQPTAGEVLAFTAVCPHEGCAPAPDGERFSCPCHGSQFGLDGSLQQGPAATGLTSYAVRIMDGQVLPA